MRYKVWYEYTWTHVKDSEELTNYTLEQIDMMYNTGSTRIIKVKRLRDKPERSDYEEGFRDGFLLGIPVTILCGVLSFCAIAMTIGLFR